MGKTKVGKQRKDKFYKLAKETGYRSRASFKLIQLNRKFEFLQKSRVLIDLCAAPGGWLQVAQQTMPVSSLIVGVDLVSIKPLHNVITLQDDITADSCKQALKRELKTWKVDTVLHDGAPNVGRNWLHDAYAQNQLTLSALKLACEFLVRGGWFVTKVFRSKDYNALLWVLKKLFKKVHVTKPQASRNESAEIFVIGQGYIAPDKLDPKFLDPSHVFDDVQANNETKANIERIAKPKKKAEGYEGEVSVFNQLKVSDFMFSSNHLEKLAACTQIIFDDEDIEDHRLTTDEIKECCKDVRVLGKGELRKLLNWRKTLRETVKQLESKEVDPSVPKSTDVVEIEEREIADALTEAEELQLRKAQELKQKKRKLLKERRKLHEKMNLKMIIKNDEPIIQEDLELFKMSQLKNKEDIDEIGDDVEAEFNLDPDEVPQENEEERAHYRKLYTTYDRHDDYDPWGNEDRRPAKKAKLQEPQPPRPVDDESDVEEEMEFESGHDDDDSQEKILDSASVNHVDRNPLIVDLAGEGDVNDRVTKWFDKKEFEGINEDNDLEMELLAEAFEKKNEAKKAKSSVKKSDAKKINLKKVSEDEINPTEVPLNSSEKSKSKSSVKKSDAKKINLKNVSEDEISPTEVPLSSSEKSECNGISDAIDPDKPLAKEPVDNKKAHLKTYSPETSARYNLSQHILKPTSRKQMQGKKKKRVILDPEGLALGTLMIQSKKMRRDISDNSYNRYSSNDDGLPEWFIRDEAKHYHKQIPVTAEMVKEYKEQLKAINARPLKKVIEAKSRKKRKALKRLERARKRAEVITESLDMTEKEKAEQVKTIYKKATMKKDNSVTYVVAKKGVGKRVRRPAGVKGRFKVVDKRMKKDDFKKKMENKIQRKKSKFKGAKRTGKKNRK